MSQTDAPEVVDQDFYVTQKTAQDRNSTPGGVYLDDVMRIEAEKVRAQVEGREPDLDNPPATVGTPLKTAGELDSTGMVVLAESAKVTLPVVTGTPELDKNGDPTGKKTYLKGGGAKVGGASAYQPNEPVAPNPAQALINSASQNPNTVVKAASPKRKPAAKKTVTARKTAGTKTPRKR